MNEKNETPVKNHLALREILPAAPVLNDRVGLERVIFFSDAVFAIAMTLLAVDIRLPEFTTQVTDRLLMQLLQSLWPQYLAFFISFIVIGSLWISHHRKFRFITRYDRRLLFLNLLLMLMIAFLPFPTKVLSDYTNTISIIFYALTVIIEGLMMAVLWLYVSHQHRLIDPQLDRQQIRREFLRTLIAPGVFGGSVPLVFVNRDLAMFSWILVAIISLAV